ncbi:MAG: GNAT family N-acetyltransferase [Planctomycetota bacterium]|nr:GNAT family N-acetyltransferase [Planctomycetota bacterium]
MSELLLRVAEPEDAEAIHAIYAPIVRETVISFEYEVPTADELAGRMANVLAQHPYLVAERGGEIAGYAYATTFRGRTAYQWGAETSVYVAEAHRRRGIARALYAAVLELLQLQGYRVAWAGITLPNDVSVAAHEAMGFVPVGRFEGAGFKHGGWYDVGFWRLPLGTQDEPPSEAPSSIRALATSAAWPATIGRPAAWMPNP